MFRLPSGLYFSACLGSLFLSILCTFCSHFFWYCFISFTMFCTPVFSLIHWFLSSSGVLLIHKNAIHNSSIPYFISNLDPSCKLNIVHTMQMIFMHICKTAVEKQLSNSLFLSLCMYYSNSHKVDLMMFQTCDSTKILTYSMQQSPSWEANWFCS